MWKTSGSYGATVYGLRYAVTLFWWLNTSCVGDSPAGKLELLLLEAIFCLICSQNRSRLMHYFGEEMRDA